MDAALSGVPGSEPAVLAALLASAGNATPQREAALTMVAAFVLATRLPEIPLRETAGITEALAAQAG